MMTNVFVSLLLVMLAVDVSLASGQDSLVVGGISVAIGDRQALVLSRLAKSYQVRQVEGHPNKWGIATKVGEFFEFIGTVTFDAKGAVVGISISWPRHESKDAIAAAESLYKAVAGLQAHCATPVTVHAKGRVPVAPDVEQSTLAFSCGNRRVELLVSAGGGPPGSGYLGGLYIFESITATR